MERLVILGGSESGVGTAVLALQKGFQVFVSDAGIIKDNYKAILNENSILYEEGGHHADKILNADLVMKSPGIPEKVDIVKQIRSKGIKVVSEIEFAAQFTNAILIGITGSNGKSTTTTLVHYILEKASCKAALVGNIGYSFAMAVAKGGYDYYVIEISNFQLDDIHNFRPHIAVLLNITPDHLDRYNYQMEKYVHSKFRITENQLEGDYFIYCNDDDETTNAISKYSIKAKPLPFSLNKSFNDGAFINNQEELQINQNQKTILTMSIYELALQGKHNQYNSLAASLVANVLEVRNEIIKESLSDFEGLEHRLETVGFVKNIEFINDSKATNINSTWFALESLKKPIVWIAGGLDKGNDYTVLQALVKEKVKAIVCLGKDNRKLHEAFARHVDMIANTQSAEEAVNMAYQLGSPGDAVLLSPACASFDLFENYADRGNQFRLAVKGL